MDSLYKTIALVGRLATPALGEPLRLLAALLQRRGLTVLLEAQIAAEHGITQLPLVAREEIGVRADAVIVMGGDGTMLSVARLVAPHGKPLIGINQGRLGFMTDIPLHDMEAVVPRILAGDHTPEQRILLETSVIRAGEEVHRSLAFNDVVFSRGSMGAMIEFEIFIDQQFVCSQRADGLIVSTPTGSTAYALSSGGPILQPTVPAISLVPICPQSLSNRPIVVSDTAEVAFLLTRGQDARVYFDNQSDCEIREMDRIIIRRYPQLLTILHPLGYNYYDMLRAKLRWGEKLL
ncbi:NAD kinase [Chitinilyticum litopenaei]|uniref:NAD kinase n=1 Tax=Chitinilyticum litopenaei TaxID=1121276 RepID=UPI00041AA586|nr:NAD kinase [Chitinilyticum litopenaei]